MKNQLISILTIVIIMTACNRQKSKSPDQWNETELTEWFEKGEWKKGWDIKADESVNQQELAIQYYRNPERWEKAFSFLKSEDLAGLAPGRYELEGPDLFVNIDEYVTKNEEEARFEAHRKYADIQYLVSGEEKIGVTALKNTSEIVPYDREKDIAFYTANENNFRLATPGKFFVFFPDDAHRPCVRTSGNNKVRKVVIKVRID